MEMLSRGYEPEYGSGDTSYLRRRIAVEIIQGKLKIE